MKTPVQMMAIPAQRNGETDSPRTNTDNSATTPYAMEEAGWTKL